MKMDVGAKCMLVSLDVLISDQKKSKLQAVVTKYRLLLGGSI